MTVREEDFLTELILQESLINNYLPIPTLLPAVVIPQPDEDMTPEKESPQTQDYASIMLLAA